jgi:CheY-like chemotaxis protein
MNVLVVEDEVLVRLMLAEVLRDQGFHVFEAANADEAIAVLGSLSVDVVITDLHMRAVGEGVLVAKYVRGRRLCTWLVLASAHPPIATERTLFDAFFIKPYRPEDIAIWIKRGGPRDADRKKGVLP